MLIGVHFVFFTSLGFLVEKYWIYESHVGFGPREEVRTKSRRVARAPSVGGQEVGLKFPIDGVSTGGGTIVDIFEKSAWCGNAIRSLKNKR